MSSTMPAETKAFEVQNMYIGHVNERLSATMNSADRFVNFSGLVAAATVTAGIIGNEPLIAILAPYALTILFAYQVQLYTDAERLGILLRHLEGNLNKQIDLEIWQTQKIFDRGYRNRLSVRGMQALYGVILAVATFISLIQSNEHFGTGWLIVNIIALASCLLVLGAAVWELTNAQTQVEDVISRAIPTGNNETSKSDIGLAD